jgi:hypothetical protein
MREAATDRGSQRASVAAYGAACGAGHAASLALPNSTVAHLGHGRPANAGRSRAWEGRGEAEFTVKTDG